MTALRVPPIPTPRQVDGAELLDELRQAFTRYVVLPSLQAADAVTLWVAATHAQPAWEHAPRLAVVSPLKRCGKSRLLDVVAETCHAPLITVNATIAAVVRSIGADPPTLLVDEAATLWGTRKQADNGWRYDQPLTPCAACGTGTSNRAPSGRPPASHVRRQEHDRRSRP